MMNGQPLSATLPDDSGLGERFWYWHGNSGQRYIHSIYRPDLCPQVPGAVFVLVRKWGLTRRPVKVGRFDAAGKIPLRDFAQKDVEIHVHLLARDEAGANGIMQDLLAAMDEAVQSPAALPPLSKPVQLDLLAA